MISKKQWDRLKPATRRIKMAEDVLATLRRKNNRFKVKTDEYCKFVIPAQAHEPAPFEDKSVQVSALLPKIERHCEACAMGALLLAHVRLVNHVTIADLDYWSTNNNLDATESLVDTLSESLSEKELRTIEAAFEGNVKMNNVDEWTSITADNISRIGRKWKSRIRSAEPRLEAIMRNIIKHKGDFDITDLPKFTKKAVTRG